MNIWKQFMARMRKRLTHRRTKEIRKTCAVMDDTQRETFLSTVEKIAGESRSPRSTWKSTLYWVEDFERESAYWSVTLDGTIEFRQCSGGDLSAHLLPSVCRVGCAGVVNTSADLAKLIRHHLDCGAAHRPTSLQVAAAEVATWLRRLLLLRKLSPPTKKEHET